GELGDRGERLRAGHHHRSARLRSRRGPLGAVAPSLGSRRRLGRLLGLVCLLGGDQAGLEELVAKVLHGAGWLLTTPRVPHESPVLGSVRFRAALSSSL